MITPVIIPMNTGSSNPDTCPSCGKIEETIKVCKHCGHEYEDESSGCLVWFVGLFILALIIWICVTVLIWLTCYGSDCSLLNTLKEQWEWITELKIY